MKAIRQQPWLASRSIDCSFILLPAFLPLFIVLLFPSYFIDNKEVTTIWWIFLVLLIDVAHVYSTLFRFYWEKETFSKFKYHLIIIPVVSLITGITLYIIGAMIFWRILAYLAVFHFIRQQYGFMRLYARQENTPSSFRFIDSLTIYNATLFPLLYWHTHKTNDINWFIKNDFITLPQNYGMVFEIIYYAIIVLYIFKEFIASIQFGINIPKNILIVGTYVSWYAGIVAFDGDLIFTMMNVVAHGIPYMALVYIHAQKKSHRQKTKVWLNISVFLVAIFFLAYLEEGLWDVFIWKDHGAIFPFFTSNSPLTNPTWLSIIVPILALPQITHYILDGFIWKISKSA